MDNVMTPLEILNIAVWEQICGLRSAMRTRSAHPTYGVTKRDLRHRLDMLVGVAHAAQSVQTGFVSASPWMAAVEWVEGNYDFDLDDLRQEVEGS